MKNSTLFFVLISSISSFSQGNFIQKDTLQFTADSSYSRAISRYSKNELLFGTSKNGVLVYNEKTGVSTTILNDNAGGEFRDVVASKQGVFGMVSGDNGFVFQSKAGRISLFYAGSGEFFDDLALQNNQLVLLGDPIGGHFILRKFNLKKGELIEIKTLKNEKEEACFAASASTSLFFNNGDYGFISGGGASARFHRFNWKDTSSLFSVKLPLAIGEGAGPFSVYFSDDLNGCIVGGNYTQPNAKEGTSCTTNDGGKTWMLSKQQANGYRSCVTGIKNQLFCCGTNGIDVSTDGGITWKSFDTGNYCALLFEKGKLYATTNKGKFVRYKLK